MKLENFLYCVENGIIPPESPDGLTANGFGFSSLIGIDYTKARHFCIDYGMWAIVTQTWTARLAEWINGNRVLEVMAGCGWLAKALSEHGINVIATDNRTWHGDDWHKTHSKAKDVYPVEILEATKAVKKYSDEVDILIVSWPPLYDETICKVGELWGNERPIVYIGECNGGCNAPEKFFNHFVEVDDEPDIPLFSWYGIHDNVYIGYYRK